MNEWQNQNLQEIEKLDDEIEYLEKKLRMGDSKKRKKVQESIEMEGMGVGFLSFLDSIENTVKNPLKVYKK